MEVFKTNKKFFALLCLWPVGKETNGYIKSFYIWFSAMTVFLLISSIVSEIFVAMKYFGIDFLKFSYTLYMMSGICPSLYSMVFLLISRDDVKNTIEGFQQICDLCKFEKCCFQIRMTMIPSSSR